MGDAERRWTTPGASYVPTCLPTYLDADHSLSQVIGGFRGKGLYIPTDDFDPIA